MVAAARQVAEAEGIADAERGYRLVFNVGRRRRSTRFPTSTCTSSAVAPMTWPPG